MTRSASRAAPVSKTRLWRSSAPAGREAKVAAISMDRDFADAIIHFALWRDPARVATVLADVTCQPAEHARVIATTAFRR
jgi:hypothetical protein